MLKVGLTGGIGSGKSVVARVFSILGIPVYQADAEARRLMEEDHQLRAALAQRFGSGIYVDGRLDRNAMAARLFGNDAAVADANALVHPVVRADFERWAAEQQSPYAIMEAALMAENEGWRRFDAVVAVACPEAERIRRVMVRDQATEGQVRARMRHQASEEERLRIAHHVIRNDGCALVIPQVLAVHQELLQHAR
jgi:dephospho-CoA kinase